MSFRTRLALAAAAAVAAGILVSSAVVFLIVRNELRETVDQSLTKSVKRMSHAHPPGEAGSGPAGLHLHRPPRPRDEPGSYMQLVDESGKVIRRPDGSGGSVTLPVTGRTREIAQGRESPSFKDAQIGGIHVRMLEAPLADGVAVQVTRPLTQVDSELARIRLWLFLVALGGIGTAAAIGLLVARAALTPLKQLIRTAEHVSRTRDLGSRIAVRGTDELSRLAATWNTMLAALEEAVQAADRAAQSQRQLVADASHELSTPLTSLRTNIELLLRNGRLSPDEAKDVATDVVEQLGEMGHLIDELVELARGDERSSEPEEVPLHLVVDDVVERIRRSFPETEIVCDVRPTTVWGVPRLIARAAHNLLENAAKWNTPGRPIEVVVAEGTLTVRDYGPGIDPVDLPHIFDRFYRSREARCLPGSGLGLAIVKQVAEAHGGAVTAEAPAGGGTLMRLTFPVAAPDGHDGDVRPRSALGRPAVRTR